MSSFSFSSAPQSFCACFHLSFFLRVFPFPREYYSFRPCVACFLPVCYGFHFCPRGTHYEFRFVSGFPGAAFDCVFDFLFGDFIAACERRIVDPPAPVTVPVPAPVLLHTIPLSVVLENLYRVDTPPPPSREATGCGYSPCFVSCFVPPSCIPIPYPPCCFPLYSWPCSQD